VTDVSWLGPPIDVRPLFAEQQAALLALLRQLSAGQWDQPTVCPGWTVKDIAAHVLGDHIGVLSRHRDGYPAQHPRDGEAFPVFLDRINAEWVTAARRMSPLVLSEFWTHHQQICDATGQPGLTSARYLGTVLDTFMRALPHTLRGVAAPPGTSLEVLVTGPAGGTWRCTRDPDRWGLQRVAPAKPGPPPAARLERDQDTAWRLCTRGITPELAAARARTEGDDRLAGAALQLVSIIW
jgi:uncharacterized protein (TIGR03083 family)